MEVLLEEEKPKKNTKTTTVKVVKKVPQSNIPPIKQETRKPSANIDDLLNVGNITTPKTTGTTTKKKVVVKKVVKKVVKSNSEEKIKEPNKSSTVLPSFSSDDEEVDLLPKAAIKPEDNPYSFFNLTLPPNPVSDEEDDLLPPIKIPVDNPFSFFNPKSVPLQNNDIKVPLYDSDDDSDTPALPNIEEDSSSDDNFDDSFDAGGLPPVYDLGENWRERALKAESELKKVNKLYSSQKKQLKVSDVRIAQLTAKEKYDAEQMDSILQQVEQNLQSSREKYEAQIRKLKTELQNVKMMLYHVAQNGSLDIPENFGEYQKFMDQGKVKVKHSSEQLNHLAVEAEKQIKNLLAGCAMLKDISQNLANFDKVCE